MSLRQKAYSATYTSAQSGAVLVPGWTGSQADVYGCVITGGANNAASPSVSIKVGSQVVFSHPGVPAGGGLVASGFRIAGDSGEAVTVDCSDPAGSLFVMVAIRRD